MGINEIKLRILYDSERRITGFDIESMGVSENEVFCRELPQALVKGRVTMKIVNNELVVSNPTCSIGFIDGHSTVRRFPLSDQERHDLQEVFDSPNVRPHASLGGFGRKNFEARFERF